MAQPPAKPSMVLADLIDLPSRPTVDIVDIGAMIEGEARYEPLMRQGLGRVVGFEPNDEQREKLNTVYAGRRKFLPNFLGKGGPATFRLARYPGCSSLYAPDAALIDAFATFSATSPGGNFTTVGTFDVQTTRLDDIPEARPCDFVKLDVQGAELDILENAPAFLSDVLVIEVETEFLPLYEGQPLFADIDAFLRGQGFMLHKMIDMGGRGYMPFEVAPNPKKPISQILWADSIYIRPFWEFDRLSAEKLLKTALILFDMYQSFDLVGVLLRHYDAATGGDVFGRYLTALKDAAPRLSPLFCNIRDWD